MIIIIYLKKELPYFSQENKYNSMKKLKQTLILVIIPLFFASCEDEFMEYEAESSQKMYLKSSNIKNGSPNALLFCYGLFCSAEVIVFSIAKNTSKSSLAGTVFACVNMIIMLGGVIFQPLVGKLLDYFWSGNLQTTIRIYSEADYQLVLSFLPLSLIFVAIAIFFVRET